MFRSVRALIIHFNSQLHEGADRSPAGGSWNASNISTLDSTKEPTYARNSGCMWRSYFNSHFLERVDFVY